MSKATWKTQTREQQEAEIVETLLRMAQVHWESSIERAEYEYKRWQSTGNKAALRKANDWMESADHAAWMLCGYSIYPSPYYRPMLM
jgi:hypothetical protein